MTQARLQGGPATPSSSDTWMVAAPAVNDPLTDTYAWTGVFLNDGRMISIAWLRGYAGAVASPRRVMS